MVSRLSESRRGEADGLRSVQSLGGSCGGWSWDGYGSRCWWYCRSAMLSRGRCCQFDRWHSLVESDHERACKAIGNGNGGVHTGCIMATLCFLRSCRILAKSRAFILPVFCDLTDMV